MVRIREHSSACRARRVNLFTSSFCPPFISRCRSHSISRNPFQEPTPNNSPDDDNNSGARPRFSRFVLSCPVSIFAQPRAPVDRSMFVLCRADRPVSGLATCRDSAMYVSMGQGRMPRTENAHVPHQKVPASDRRASQEAWALSRCRERGERPAKCGSCPLLAARMRAQ